ncbi:thioredoxin-like domain-containing protein [Thalassoglobus sp. JC818]|uniref:thioredoxin-like domain-containing protein n=1 Tax=Thalassoglobus sp. JC818 TaxID=3232136 RepID=UPI0034590564
MKVPAMRQRRDGMRFGLISGVLMALLFGAGLVAPERCSAQDSEQNAPTENPYPGRVPAPSLDGGLEWLNTSGPISIRDLRGKVVLLDFWTYCCINCIHVLPDLKYLEQKYPNELVVIGVHAAKFDNEKESENIREAIIRYEIEHPVVNDGNMTIARKYGFSSWPTLMLIDPEGNFVGRQSGEGNRELFDQVIGQMVNYHRSKGTLDETPIKFLLERQQEPARQLNYPGKIHADEAGNRLFISDSNHNRIVVTTLDGDLIDVIGSGQIGADDGDYKSASFDHPQGTVLIGNTLYVADTENHLIRTVDLDKKQVSTLAGTGVQARRRANSGSISELPLNSPWALEHQDGVLYIAMAGPHQLWKHTLGSDTIEVFAGTGREDVIDGPLDASALAQPSAITSDGEALYFVDSEGSAVREVRDGKVTTLVGPHDIRGALFEFGDIDGVGDSVRLQHPIGLVHHDGMLYVADTYNDRIKKIGISSRTAESWLGNGERGNSLDPLQLNEPAGVAATSEALYVADTNNHRILKVNWQTGSAKALKIEGLNPPQPPQTQQVVELVAGPGEEQPAVTVKPGAPLNVTVQFDLPIGYKLNKLAPVIYQVGAKSTPSVIDSSAIGKRQQASADEISATVSVPMTGQEGQGTLELSVSYQYCRDGIGGVCKAGEKKWTIPVNVSADGTTTSVEVIATP